MMRMANRDNRFLARCLARATRPFGACSGSGGAVETRNGITPMKPHRATLILILGILSLVLCAPLGIAAWIMGNGDLKEMDAGTMDPSGRSNTNAGRICGIIGTVLLIIGVVVGIGAIIIGTFAAVATHH